MADQTQLTGKERFSHLEDKIYRVSECFKHARAQNNQLKEELDTLNRRHVELQAKYDRLEEVLTLVRTGKEQIHDKVKAVLAVVDALEKGKR